jgi:dolichyl-phosphate beta-glucosyltransferase
LLSVVIPVYNEEKRIRQTLLEVDEYLAPRHPEGFEILCSDDGSTDRSAEIIAELADRLPVRLLRSPRNEGKGAAVVRGMLEARGDPVFFFDADLSTPLFEIARFLSLLDDGADVVIGTRKHPEALIERPQPWHRVHLGLAYTRIVHLLTGTRLSDYTCGFKAFRHRACREVFERSRIRGWSFDAEIMFLARHRGFKIVELPVNWIDDPDSKVRLMRAIVGSFLELLLIRLNQLRGCYR